MDNVCEIRGALDVKAFLKTIKERMRITIKDEEPGEFKNEALLEVKMEPGVIKEELNEGFIIDNYYEAPLQIKEEVITIKDEELGSQPFRVGPNEIIDIDDTCESVSNEPIREEPEEIIDLNYIWGPVDIQPIRVESNEIIELDDSCESVSNEPIREEPKEIINLNNICDFQKVRTEPPLSIESAKANWRKNIKADTSGTKSTSIFKHNNRYVCRFCEYNGESILDLKSHLAKHTQKTLQSCPHCAYSCVEADKLEAHIITMHSRTSVQTQTLENCMNIHFSERPYSCSYCKYTCVESSSLKRHLLVKHSSMKSHSCPHCDFSCLRPRELKLHIMAEHNSDKCYSCTCGYSCFKYKQLKEHMVKLNGKGSHSFQACKYRATESRSLKNHVMTEYSGDGTLKCPYCDFCCISTSSLKIHMSKHAGVKSHCSLNCVHSVNFECHVAKHCGENSYSCTHCECSCIDSLSLKKHNVKYSALEQYSSPHCESHPVSSGAQKKPISTNHKKKFQYSCFYCGHRTNSYNNINQHISQHSGLDICRTK